MWRPFRRPRIPNYDFVPAAEAGVVTARYNLNGRRDVRTGSRKFYACRIEVLNAEMITISAPVTGDVGDAVLVKIDCFGEVRGSVGRRTRTGFVMIVAVTDSERAKLKRKIEWFENVRSKKTVDHREHHRFAPEEPFSTVILGDGSTTRCYVIDMSASGAAITARIVPPVGTPLAVGKIVGRVVRHLPNGFAIRFITPVDINTLEALLIKPLLGSTRT